MSDSPDRERPPDETGPSAERPPEVNGPSDLDRRTAAIGGVRRLSPLSVPYRIFERGVGPLLTLLFVGVSVASALGETVGAAAIVALVGLGAVAFVVYEVSYYRRFSYELTADTLDLHSGVFSRRDREIPLRRVQNVDVTRGAVQRVVGIAAVRVETAGGSDTEGVLRYVSSEEARRLQTGVAARKRRLESDDDATEETPEPAGETLFELSDFELLLAGALSVDLRIPTVLFFLFSGSLPAVLPRFSAAGDALVVLFVVGAIVAIVAVGWVTSVATAVVNYYGFTLRRVGDDLRYERGLLQRYDGSIPLEKVQTLTVRDNPLKRRFGYASLVVETAGYSPGASQGQGNQSATVVPIASRDRVTALATEIEPHGAPAFERPPRRVRRRYAVRYGLVVAAATALTFAVDRLLVSIPWYLPLAALPLAAVFGHYVWVHRGVWLGDDHMLTRNGFLRRETRVVPYDRVQTVIDSRSLLQRRWRVATVTADTAGSLSVLGRDAAAVDVAAGRADELREELRRRLADALARGG